MINICCCLRIKSKQISELSQKRGFNGSTGVIGYADFEYNIVNNIFNNLLLYCYLGDFASEFALYVECRN